MRKLIVLGAAVAAFGCGGGPDPEQDQRIMRKIDQVELQLERKITEMKEKMARVLEMEQKTKNALEDITKLVNEWKQVRVDSDQKLDKVNQVLATSLKTQEKALKEQLETVKNMLQEVQKK